MKLLILNILFLCNANEIEIGPKYPVSITCTTEEKIDIIIDNLLPKIAMIESSNNPLAKGDYTGSKYKAYGLLQIHNVCVQECNNKWNTSYTHNDMFDPIKAKDVFRKTLTYGINKHIKKYKEFPKEEYIVRMWNASYYSYLTLGEPYYKKFKTII